jgi:hypothetical protein
MCEHPRADGQVAFTRYSVLARAVWGFPPPGVSLVSVAS